MSIVFVGIDLAKGVFAVNGVDDHGRPALPTLDATPPTVRELLYVVHQAVRMPLRIDLVAPAQREARRPLVVSQVATTGPADAALVVMKMEVFGPEVPHRQWLTGREQFIPKRTDTEQVRPAAGKLG